MAKEEILRRFEAGRSEWEEETQAPSTAPAARSWTFAELFHEQEVTLPLGIMEGKLLRPGTVAMVVGEGGIGKTRLCLAAASSAAAGKDFGPFSMRKVRISYLSEELSDAEMRTLLRETFSAEEVERLAGTAQIRCRSGFRAERPEKIARRIRTVLEQAGKPELAFIDALADIHDFNENDNREMGRLLRVLRDEVATPLSCCLSLIHHSGKPSEFASGINLGRGASVLRDVVADVVTVEWKRRTATSGPRILRLVKRRYLPPAAAVEFDLAEDLETGLVAVEFFNTPGETREKEREEEKAERRAAAVEKLQETILKELHQNPGVNSTQLQDASSAKKADFLEARAALERRGAIRHEPGKGPEVLWFPTWESRAESAVPAADLP